MSKAVKKTGNGKKKGPAGYKMPAPVPLGTILTDISKTKWKVGKSIGTGGFGEIYSACKADSVSKKPTDYPFVVKIEPHQNGPLFVEMHFYMRNAKQDEIEKFKKSKGLKSLGMPYFIGNGSEDIDGEKHRFLVMPRYGQDLMSIYLDNGSKFPVHTVYRLAIQMLDVLEYVHQCTYVHADLKAANILLGMGKDGNSQVYLVDFGLASHYTTKDFKPDPKKMHNGTIEYTSRDAHQGVPTMRGDLEILAYNLIHWSGIQLPWEGCLNNPVKVHESKETHMQNYKKLCKDVTQPIQNYVKIVSGMEYNDQPEYQKIRKIFESGLKELGKTNSGDLEFTSKGVSKKSNKKETVDSPAVKKASPRRKRPSTSDLDQSSPEAAKQVKAKKASIKKPTVIEESDEEEVIKPTKTKRSVKKEAPIEVSDEDENVSLSSRRNRSTTDLGLSPAEPVKQKKLKKPSSKMEIEDSEDEVLVPKITSSSRRKRPSIDVDQSSPEPIKSKKASSSKKEAVIEESDEDLSLSSRRDRSATDLALSPAGPVKPKKLKKPSSKMEIEDSEDEVLVPKITSSSRRKRPSTDVDQSSPEPIKSKKTKKASRKKEAVIEESDEDLSLSSRRDRSATDLGLSPAGPVKPKKSKKASGKMENAEDSEEERPKETASTKLPPNEPSGSIRLKRQMGKPTSKKTYEFNFELDVSFDADVVVNVQRKKKMKPKEQEQEKENGKDDNGGSEDEFVPESPKEKKTSRKAESPLVEPKVVNKPVARAGEYKGKKAKC